MASGASLGRRRFAPGAWVVAQGDAALVALALVASVLMALAPDNPPGTGVRVVALLLAPALALPVIWWRRAPLLAAAMFPLGVLLTALPTFDQTRCGVAIPIALLILFSVGARLPVRRALAGLALVMAGMLLLRGTDPLLADPSSLFILPLAAAAWLVGRLVRSQAALAAELAARTARLEERRASVARLAAQIERSRMAVVLDDDVRRLVGTILGLSGGEIAGAEPFATIERKGRETLNLMRDLVGALRSDADA